IIAEIEDIIKMSSIKVYFSKKKISKSSKNYATIHPKISKEVESWLREAFINFIQENIMPVSDYNPISKKNDYIDVPCRQSIWL
ncbi:hypothetical protein BUY23_12925, partial [Staphylococcus cohnii]